MGTHLPSPKRGYSPKFSADVYCGQTVVHLSYCWALVFLKFWEEKRCALIELVFGTDMLRSVTAIGLAIWRKLQNTDTSLRNFARSWDLTFIGIFVAHYGRCQQYDGRNNYVDGTERRTSRDRSDFTPKPWHTWDLHESDEKVLRYWPVGTPTPESDDGRRLHADMMLL